MQPQQLGEWVSFVPNKERPIHNWFYYKEGFSEPFVEWCVKEFQLKAPVLDPFCGVGTTLLTCKKLGLESFGSDVSPLASFVAKVKTRNYDVQELQSAFEQLKQLKPEPIERIPLHPKVRKLFYHKALETLWFYKDKMETIEDEKIRNLFLLALIDTTGRVANVVKVGGSLRKQKKPGMPVQKLLLGKIQKMLLDVKRYRLSKVEPVVQQQDARLLELEPESIGAVITSPPYLNKIEYTSVYKLELGIFFEEQETKLRAFMGDTVKEPVAEFASLPLVAQGYFSDLKKVLQNIFPALQPGGKAIFNIAGGCFPHGPLQSDEVLEGIAEQIGFEKIQNITCRWVQCHSQYRSEKAGKMKEAVLVFSKKE